MRDQASRCIENLLIDLNKIEEEKIGLLRNNLQMVKAYGAQTKLPGGD